MNCCKLMCGIPGCGKSSFIKDNAKPEDIVVSRDKIRFDMIKDNEPYFAKERAVFREFCNQITEGLNAGKTVWADATHINEASREKIFSAIGSRTFIDRIEVYEIDCDITVAIAQNNLRNGCARVPLKVIEFMASNKTRPQFDKRSYDAIYYRYNDTPVK